MLNHKTSMRVSCRVLLALADEGEMTTKGIADFTGLDIKQIGGTLTELCKKQKVKRVSKADSGGYVYAFSEEWEPSERPKRILSKTMQAKCFEKDKVNAPIMLTFGRLGERKINVLQSFLKKANPQERDVLLGIIADYVRMRPAKVA